MIYFSSNLDSNFGIGVIVMRRHVITILGAGNSGLAHTAYFKHLGHEVRLFDFFQETVDRINQNGYIELTGYITDNIAFEAATTSMKDAVTGSEVIIVINPSQYHRKLAAELAKYLSPNQIIFINPGSTFGALAFKQALVDNGFTADVPIAESNTSVFPCRLIAPTKVYIGAKKDRILFSVFPSQGNLEKVSELVSSFLPEIQPVKNVLATSIDNTNPHVHVAPMILNCSWIESGQQFSFMHEAIGPTVEKIIAKMDAERLEIGKKLGLTLGKDLFSLQMQYEEEYNVTGKTTLREIFRGVDAYRQIYSPHSFEHRYITEDVPMGLTPLVDMGRQIGVPVPKSQMILNICEEVLEKNFTEGSGCRNMDNIGLKGLSAEEIVKYAETGSIN